MDLPHLFAMFAYYGPTPIAALLAGIQAMQCKSTWQAFFVALIGTVVLAFVFGLAADYVPLWGVGSWVGQVSYLHLMISPCVGIPLGAFCAYRVHQRELPPNNQAG